jgi:meso-butanediol dehydrogenase / (S,S)-butanediol dehydrogenase / diacetyl reductase
MSNGRVSVVTGGASGLGEAIVNRLASDGDHVVVADVDEPRARLVVDNLVAAGLWADMATVDVTSEGEVAAMFDGLMERHGRLDALVCSAAIETRSSVVDCADDDWQRVLDVNLKGPFLCCKHGIPAIARTGGGSVVLLGSVLGAIGSPGYAAYCTSKGALVNLAKQAAIEHAPDQVRVNVVSPSATDTGLFARVAARSDDPERMMQMVAANTPMQRLGTATEVAATVAFLCSDGAAFISGTVIPLDGGMAARRIV